MTQDLALKILQSGANTFITGSAGTGKTYVINQYINYLRERKLSVAITASTGIAATHMDGVTIHSWSGMGVKDRFTEEDYKRLKKRTNFVKRLANTNVLIIDEISMLHKKQLELLDEILRYFRDPFLPFGGLQLVVSGDFFQLPPIDRTGASSRDIYCFMSDSWVKADFSICYLTEQYRQSKNSLHTILNEIRKQQISEHSIQALQNKVSQSQEMDWEIYPHLYTHNVNVDQFNEEKLTALDGTKRKYIAKAKGRANLVDQLKRNVTVPEELVLKEGAEVMFVRNNAEEGYVNGTLGIIVEFNMDGFPVVLTRNGVEIDASPVAWTIENEQGKTLAEYEQIPLRLAWAVTIHKSQGMTLDSACINLLHAFEVGQGYVALSRLKDFEGLTLLGINNKALELNKLAYKADQRFQVLSKQLELDFDEKQAQSKAINFIKNAGGIVSKKAIKQQKDKLKNKESKTPSYMVSIQLFEKGNTVAEIAEERGLTKQTILGHFSKLKKENPEYDFSKLQLDDKIFEQVNEQLSSISPDEKNVFTIVYSNLNGSVSYDDIRIAYLKRNEAE